ncbi:MAG: hypothetical protein ACMG6H_16720, partial [Acidobacteriota bacterium]
MVRCNVALSIAKLIGLSTLLSVGVPSRQVTNRIDAGKTYFVDPRLGNDANSGTRAAMAWKSLIRVNQLRLGPGDTVLIGPGVHDETLMPNASGSGSRPVVIRFAPGRHLFSAKNALSRSYFVSNSADSPTLPRPIGIFVKDSHDLRIVGVPGTEILFGARMTYLVDDHARDITYSGLNFDMVRPTVSEFKVVSTSLHSVVIQVAEGSTYTVNNGRFNWSGDLGPGWTMVQEAIPSQGKCWRRGRWDPFVNATATQLGGGRVLLTYLEGTMGLEAGHQFQFRNVIRDTTSGVNTRCKNITFRNCNFYALPGMAIVSQFTENITFDHVNVVPRPGTNRTCPAWADCFHFSGCRGQVLVDSCRFSGTQDDPINVHGTHLCLVERSGDKQVLVRFMHSQTYGFAAFQEGDEIAFTSHLSLCEYGRAKVQKLERVTDTDWRLTLDRTVPVFAPNDVVENVTWNPNVVIRNCHVTMDSCRGFLITTRNQVVIENNMIASTMSAVDIAD